jgi:hypothetical protein
VRLPIRSPASPSRDRDGRRARVPPAAPPRAPPERHAPVAFSEVREKPRSGFGFQDPRAEPICGDVDFPFTSSSNATDRRPTDAKKRFPPKKKQTAHVGLSPETGLLPGIPGKRCAHCNTQTTPLWRNGPDGAKTLCNACGVRDNRRHAKTRGPARPRPRKPEPGVAATTARLKKAAAAAAAAAELGEDAANGGRRSARWNAGLLTKRAKAESLDDAARRARKRQRGGFHGAALHDEPGADVGADGTIFTPTSVDVADYDAGNDGTFVPSSEYVSARPRGAVGRFAPGGAAPLYDATAADKAWLSQTNAGRPAHEHLRERQLEHLFDVFEEASWHSGSVPGDAAEAYDVLGYGGASVAEAEAAVKSGEMFVDFAAEEDLLSPAGAHVGLGHEGLEWDAVEPLKRSKPADAHTELKHENGSDRSYTPPLTPSGSVELATFVRAESASASVEGFGASAGGSPGGSVPSRSADDTDVDDDHEDGSDNGDGSVFGSDASGNGKSSDLAARATVTSSGRATRAAARGAGAGAGLLQVNKETSELSERLTDGDETRQKRRGRRTNQKAASGAKGAAGVFKKKKNEAGGGGGVRGATTDAPADSRAARRATRAARAAPVANGARNPSGRARVVPTMRDAELAFGRYIALRAENGGSALLARFARPAPPQLRARALLGGAAAGAGDAEDEAEAASVMAAAAAGEYQFVLGFEGVQRQQRERAARGEAIKEASRRRRRRACFNPAASKRRRKQQAAMEIAIEAPLQIVHDASPFAFGQLDQLPIDAEPAPAPDPLPEPEPAVHSEWESDDDLPLAALAGREESPDVTLADIAAQTARMEAEARRRAAVARAERKAAAAKRAPGRAEYGSASARRGLRDGQGCERGELRAFALHRPRQARGRVPGGLAVHAAQAAHAARAPGQDGGVSLFSFFFFDVLERLRLEGRHKHRETPRGRRGAFSRARVVRAMYTIQHT